MLILENAGRHVEKNRDFIPARNPEKTKALRLRATAKIPRSTVLPPLTNGCHCPAVLDQRVLLSAPLDQRVLFSF
jgi:hypothetical protein